MHISLSLYIYIYYTKYIYIYIHIKVCIYIYIYICTHTHIDLLLAVAEVVVGEEGHDEAAPRPDADLECAPVVVALVGRLPGHAVAALALGRVEPVRQSEVLLGHFSQVRREDDAARLSAPVLDVERSVVLWKAGVARVAEDGLHEVHVGDHGARRHQPDLHALLEAEAGHLRAHERAQQHLHPGLLGLGLARGEGDLHAGPRRAQGAVEQPAEGKKRHRLLVVRYGKRALGDVEDADGRALVAQGVVEDTVVAAEGLDEVVLVPAFFAAEETGIILSRGTR